ncbi:ECF sigma factor [Nitrospira sp. KM1]|uniref:RNA polymerase sigma factor n=1 Tax=Nitrospira sp. KM1 TaxID=1936990 RepID=UPI0013A7272B|nr:sigma-70 family RNA polymerase sigma factor [Nitrospira sp. KM1]BCA56539.1 ECF sigma factor [Nitrospira sp. KM1]
MAAQDYEQLFHSAGDDLRRFLSRRITCPHAVSDMMQEAFLKLMGAQPATDIKDPRAYLFRIAANLAINHGTRRRDVAPPSAVSNSTEALPEVSDERTPERVVEGNRQLRRVMDAIESLPERCKEVFILYRFHSMSQTEIAEQLGISVSMVEKHVIRAMRYCRDARDQAD